MMRERRERERENAYGPDVGGYKEDHEEGAEPGVTDGETDVKSDVGAHEVPQGPPHHPHRQWQR